MTATADKRSVALAVLLVPAATLLLFVLLIALSSRGWLGETGSTGSISLSDISLVLEEGQLYLDAQASIDLPSTIKAGLDSGVPLDFVLTLRFVKPRRFWLDSTLATFEQRYSLTYYELTRHYRVQATEGGLSRNYRSLSSALSGLGEFQRLPLLTNNTSVFLVDERLAFDGEPAEVLGSLVFQLDAKSLPLPLQPLIMSSWRLASKEYQWTVN